MPGAYACVVSHKRPKGSPAQCRSLHMISHRPSHYKDRAGLSSAHALPTVTEHMMTVTTSWHTKDRTLVSTATQLACSCAAAVLVQTHPSMPVRRSDTLTSMKCPYGDTAKPHTNLSHMRKRGSPQVECCVPCRRCTYCTRAVATGQTGSHVNCPFCSCAACMPVRPSV